MSPYEYRMLRNHLMTLACTVNIWTPEYRNLCKRIKIINDKDSQMSLNISAAAPAPGPKSGDMKAGVMITPCETQPLPKRRLF